MDARNVGEGRHAAGGCQLRKDWESLFSPTALSRGYRYFESDAVLSLKPVEEGWLAEVEGSYAYDVFVAENVFDSECTCPYYEDHGLCKHIASACYEVVYRQGLGDGGFGGEVRQADHIPKNPAELMAKMNEEAVREYLGKILADDERWRDDFLRRFAELDESRLRLEFLNGVSGTVRSHSYRGFVDYRSAYRCERALGSYVESFLDPLVARGEYAAVFELTVAFVLHLQKVAVDDSDGFFTSMLEVSGDYWAEVYGCADPMLRRRMFEWMCALVSDDFDDADDESCVLHCAREQAESFMLEYMSKDPCVAKDVLVLAEDALDGEIARFDKAGLAVLSWHPHDTRLIRWARAKVHCMDALGVPFERQEEFVLSLPQAFPLIEPLVERARAVGDYEKALSLLERHKEQAKAYHYPTEASLMLLSLYGKLGRETQALDELVDLCLLGSPQNDEQLRSWFRKLKKRAGGKWPEYEKRIVGSLEGDQRKLREFYVEMGQMDALAASLAQSGSRYDYERFKGQLLDSYPEIYVAMYEREVRAALFGRARSRNTYRENARLIATMRSIPGGEGVAEALIVELRELFSSRWALMEELDKISRK